MVTAIRRVYVATMILRARHLFLAWLVHGILQLGLLGVPYVSGQPFVGSRDVCAQASAQSISSNRLVASERNERASHAPFAPPATVALGLTNPSGPGRLVALVDRARTFELAQRRLARPPPVRV